MSFRTERPAPRSHCVTLRTSAEQNAMLDSLVARLQVSKGEVVRIALDYWLANSPEARRALRGK